MNERSDILSTARRVFEAEIKGLEAVRDSLGESFTAAVRLIADTVGSGGIVVVTGVGKSLHIAEKISGIFSSTGTRSVVLNPVQAMHGDLGMISKGDVLAALSFSGESDEVVKLMPSVRRRGVKVIALTGSDSSTLATLADVHIAVPCGPEACPFGMCPTTSATATMAMGDALALAVMERRGFTVEDYAVNHPSGAIGRALVVKVTDIMRTGERLALVPPDASIFDAAVAMTKARSGAALVADGDASLLGIFTDGDFRRALSADPVALSSRNCAVSRYMTPSPLFVREDAYAADLLGIFESKQIDDIPVLTAEGKIAGLVDIQDLPKMKVL